jgi:3-phenylpropionate/trans-cinnamate dioxygenase ferredoxin reductase component
VTLRRIVVVGNGISGVTAADTLRAAGYDGELTLVGDETHPAYSRPALSKALLREEADLTAHLLPPPTHDATELLGRRATGLDVDARAVLLEDGAQLPYDGLVVATGCRARRLGTGQEHPPEELTLRTLDDALELRRRVAARPSVVVVGGGPLGMEIASSCLESGCEVTLVSQGPPLAQQLGEYLSGMFVSAALARGLRIVTTEGARLVRAGDGTAVVLADGTTVRAELVVTAIGDEPNVEWLASSGLLRHGLLLVDELGRVRPDIVAAGDVAAVPTPHGVRRVPLWSAAIEQSKIAARALLGQDTAALDHRPYFWTEQFGLSLKGVGHLPFAGAPTLLNGDPGEGRVLLRWEDDGTSGSGAVAAVNYRIPIPRLRRLCNAAA